MSIDKTLLHTDIWISTTEMKNGWMVYSEKGASLMEIIVALRQMMLGYII